LPIRKGDSFSAKASAVKDPVRQSAFWTFQEVNNFDAVVILPEFATQIL
jgi:hypothetical protein